MRLYIGGSYQGKKGYVFSAWAQEHPGNIALVSEGESYPSDQPERADILVHFHLLVRRFLEDGHDISDIQIYVREILAQNPNIWIICDEVGMGIVPIDTFERQYREAVGRCSCELAKEAEQVVRIICGIGVRIK